MEKIENPSPFDGIHTCSGCGTEFHSLDEFTDHLQSCEAKYVKSLNELTVSELLEAALRDWVKKRKKEKNPRVYCKDCKGICARRRKGGHCHYKKCTKSCKQRNPQTNRCTYSEQGYCIEDIK